MAVPARVFQTREMVFLESQGFRGNSTLLDFMIIYPINHFQLDIPQLKLTYQMVIHWFSTSK